MQVGSGCPMQLSARVACRGVRVPAARMHRIHAAAATKAVVTVAASKARFLYRHSYRYLLHYMFIYYEKCKCLLGVNV